MMMMIMMKKMKKKKRPLLFVLVARIVSLFVLESLRLSMLVWQQSVMRVEEWEGCRQVGLSPGQSPT
jgi:cell division protein FtsB